MTVPTIPSALPVAHRLYVMRLYRRSLKLAASWYWQRSEYCEKAMIIRSMFDENKNVTNLRHAQELLAHTENLLGIYNHSDPYISPTAPGGSKWERNVPFPEELVRRGVTIYDKN